MDPSIDLVIAHHGDSVVNGLSEVFQSVNRLGVSILTLNTVIGTPATRPEHFLPSDDHWNAKGNRLAAQAITTHLEQLK